MKKIILIAILINSALFAFGQNKEYINLIQVDSTWGKEVIKIPFWFATDINYEGYEDIRFAKGWEKPESQGFWTLAFAWDINLKAKPTALFFEETFKLYFDGLMKVVNEDKTITIPKTKVSFLEHETKKGTTTFTGTIETYDAFTTKKTIKLNVIIESYYCKNTKKFIPLFKLSPRKLNHKVWIMLKRVKLLDTTCSK